MFVDYTVKSSRPTPNIQRLAYNEDTLTARVTFQNSKGIKTATWDYWPLPPGFMELWAAAESTGKFFNDRVKGGAEINSRKVEG